jgi:hypothetical protein
VADAVVDTRFSARIHTGAAVRARPAGRPSSVLDEVARLTGLDLLNA